VGARRPPLILSEGRASRRPESKDPPLAHADAIPHARGRVTDAAPTAAPFRLRDAMRDLVRAPGLAALVNATALVIVLAPLLYYTLGVTHRIQVAADGRAAFKLYQAWCVVAVIGGVVVARCAAALIASSMVETFAQPRMRPTEASARALLHGIPALIGALLAAALVGLGVVGAIVAAFPLAALTYVAGPAAAVEQLGPSAATRRSAQLTRGVRGRIALWQLALLAIELAPFVLTRLLWLRGAKPPVAPILRAQQINGWLVIAVVVASALMQVVVYRRLRDAVPAA
jgi:hypothetical protein